MNANKRLAINAGSNLAASSINALVGLFLAPFLLRYLGQDGYGAWALIGSVFAYSSLLTLSLNSAVNRWIPLHLVDGDSDGVNRVVNTSLAFYLVAGGVLLLATAALTIWFPVWFDIGAQLEDETRTAVAIAGLGFVALTIGYSFPAILSGIQRYDLTFVGIASTDIGRMLVLLWLLPAGHGIVAVAAVTATATALRSSIHGFFAHYGLRTLRLNLRLARMSTFREMLGYSTNTMLYSWGEMIQAQAATILVGVLVGVSRVPEYSIPLLLTALISRVVTTMSTPIKPEVSRLEALGEMDRVGRLYLAVTRYGLLAILPMATFLLSYGDAVLRIWLGESFLEASPTILAILTIGVGVRLWHVPGYQVVAGLGRHRRFGALALSTGLVSVLLAGALHVFLGLGAVGVAIGFALSEALVGLFFVTPYCCVAVGLRLREEAAQSLLPALCALVPFAVAVAVARLIFHLEGFAGLVGLVAALGTVGLLATWFLGLQAEERLRIRRFWMNFGQSSQG